MDIQTILNLLRESPKRLIDLTAEQRSFMLETLSPDPNIGFSSTQLELLKDWYLIVPEIGGMDAINQFNAASHYVNLSPQTLTTGETVIPAYCLLDQLNYPREATPENPDRWIPLPFWYFIEGTVFIPVIPGL